MSESLWEAVAERQGDVDLGYGINVHGVADESVRNVAVQCEFTLCEDEKPTVSNADFIDFYGESDRETIDIDGVVLALPPRTTRVYPPWMDPDAAARVQTAAPGSTIPVRPVGDETTMGTLSGLTT